MRPKPISIYLKGTIIINTRKPTQQPRRAKVRANLIDQATLAASDIPRTMAIAESGLFELRVLLESKGTGPPDYHGLRLSFGGQVFRSDLISDCQDSALHIMTTPDVHR